MEVFTLVGRRHSFDARSVKFNMVPNRELQVQSVPGLASKSVWKPLGTMCRDVMCDAFSVRNFGLSLKRCSAFGSNSAPIEKHTRRWRARLVAQ